MDKYFNDISIVFGLVGGFVCNFLGSWDLLLKSIVILMVLDYVTGLLKSIYNKKLSSNTADFVKNKQMLFANIWDIMEF